MAKTESVPVGEPEAEPRYPVIISKYDPDTGDFKDTDATKKDDHKKIGPENKSRRAFTFRKLTMHSMRRRLSGVESLSSEIEIEFEPLQRLVGKLTSRYGWNETVTSCSSPFSALIYAWSEAMTESKKVIEDEPEGERQARVDLAELLKIISTSAGHIQLDLYFRDRKSFLNERSITHATLWTLFPPGTIIVSHPFLGEPQIFTVASCDGFVSSDDIFELVCFSFDWDGAQFGRVPYEMNIPYWGPDRKSIVELPFYPLQYYVEPDTLDDGPCEDAVARLKERLLRRGKKFVEHCRAEKGKQMFKYRGDAQFHTGRSLINHGENSDGERNSRTDDMESSAGLSRSRNANETRYVDKKRVSIAAPRDRDGRTDFSIDRWNNNGRL
jgi:hypothetical protein